MLDRHEATLVKAATGQLRTSPSALLTAGGRRKPTLTTFAGSKAALQEADVRSRFPAAASSSQLLWLNAM
ncbi:MULTISPECIES: hypothetical protein [unclassified Thiocapsa]|uniref:hypothetical protein n=1 Tax=unclassified Thiocapsa TaxID=2641286 RepID=UPI0035B49FBB